MVAQGAAKGGECKMSSRAKPVCQQFRRVGDDGVYGAPQRRRFPFLYFVEAFSIQAMDLHSQRFRLYHLVIQVVCRMSY